MNTKTLLSISLLALSACTSGDKSAVSLAGGAVVDTMPHAMTIADMIRYRRFESLALSPDGRQVAFVLREPDLARDVNEFVLYVRAVPEAGATSVVRDRGREVLRTRGFGFEFPHITFTWTGDGKGVVVLHQPLGEPRPILSYVDIASARARNVFRENFYVKEFSVDAAGKRIAVAGNVPDSAPPDRFASKHGVLIGPRDYLADVRSDEANERRLSPEDYGRPELRVADVNGASVTVARGATRAVHLSPNGRRLLYSAAGRAVLLSVPADLPRGRAAAGDSLDWPRMPAFDAPGASAVMWSDDGSAYLVTGPDPAHGPSSGPALPGSHDGSQLWAVDAASRAVSLVMNRAEAGSFNHSRRVVAFDQKARRVAVAYPRGDLFILRRPAASAAWAVETTVKTTPGVIRGYEGLTAVSDHAIVAIGSTTSTPPDLFVANLAGGANTVFTDINPELRRQHLGKVETIEWADRTTKYFGHIIYPVNYSPGTRYPCVILAKSWDKYSYIYDDQDGYRAGNFPSQLLAANGFMVFVSANPDGPPDLDVPNGSIVHRRFYGARQKLAERGLIDPARCGVRGFSHTSFEVSFLVTHPGPDPQWAAAISVDGFCPCYARTMMGKAADVSNGLRHVSTGYDPLDRGSLDDNLPLFFARAPASNTSRVRTPLLLDYHGTTTMRAGEIYGALYARGKPVEYVWFVDGAHTLTSPAERAASAQRTLDWFRFWLRGEEPAAVPDDPDRSARWRALRAQHEQNEKWIAEHKDPATEHYKLSAKRNGQ